jgi:hypothetical protein
MKRRLGAKWTAVIRGESVVLPAVTAGLVVAVVSLVVGPNRGDLDVDVALASMAAFLFGVLLAFTIVRTRERLALVHRLVARGNSSLLTIYELMSVFGEEDRTRIHALIDGHLTHQIDYRLIDYHRAATSFRQLVDAIYGVTPNSRQEKVAYKELLRRTVKMREQRALIEATTGQEMSALEWTGLFLLLLVLLSLIAVLPGGTFLGAVVAGVLAGTLVTLMVLLRRLDLLRWHERATIWEPTTRLFREMGQYPYIPRYIIDHGRYRPTGQIRVVDYPDPYPKRATKIVTLEHIDGPESEDEVRTRDMARS